MPTTWYQEAEEELGWRRTAELLLKTSFIPKDENQCDGTFICVFQGKMSKDSPYS